jgi:hypothetical protein
MLEDNRKLFLLLHTEDVRSKKFQLVILSPSPPVASERVDSDLSETKNPNFRLRASP